MARAQGSEDPPPAAKTKPRRPWRENLEAFGVAILMAVLLKPMLVEAYQIPTSSMQPTLMGSPEAGIFDRILVDKTRYEIFEPERWDIVVFRYPIRRNQNYVKRIVGLPGDRLRIAAGNLWQVGEDGALAHVLRKPDRIQEHLWKEVYPARRLLEDSATVLGSYFEGQVGEWREDGDALVAKPTASGKARLAFIDRDHEGLSNKIWDGYGTSVARAIRERGSAGHDEGVQDARFGFDVVPSANVDRLKVELRLQPPGLKERAFTLEVASGEARLRVAVANEEKAVSPPFAFALPAGTATRVAFAQVDDRLLAWRDGSLVGELEVGAGRFELPLAPRSIVLAAEALTSGELRLQDLRVERDVHYVSEGLEDALGELVEPGRERVVAHHVIRIPEGFYFMMGDNTLASADSRQWKVFTVGMNAAGELVNPNWNPDARVLRGNRRPWPLQVKPDNDENPVIVRGFGDPPADLVVLTDDNGEVFPLRGKTGPQYSDGNMEFLDASSGTPRPWVPEEQHVFFVPREHVLGRPLAAFWPLTRIGFIR